LVENRWGRRRRVIAEKEKELKWVGGRRLGSI